MYAIVNIAGKQYKVSKGDKLRVATLQAEVGEDILFDQILFTDDGKAVKIGKPTVKNASVSARILEHGRDRKILIYKKKRRKGYQRKNGHRQGYTLLEINSIEIAAPRKKSPAKSTKEAAEVNKGDK